MEERGRKKVPLLGGRGSPPFANPFPVFSGIICLLMCDFCMLKKHIVRGEACLSPVSHCFREQKDCQY